MAGGRPLVVVIPGIGGSTLADEQGHTVYDTDASHLVSRVCDPYALQIDRSLRPTGRSGRSGWRGCTWSPGTRN